MGRAHLHGVIVFAAALAPVPLAAQAHGAHPVRRHTCGRDSLREGLSGRFGHVLAVEGRDLEVRVEIEGLVEPVDRVLVDMRPLGAIHWLSRAAMPEEKAGWWRATFTSSVVPERSEGDPPQRIELKARVYGVRGGVLLEIGADEPLEVEVMKPREARAIERVLTTERGARGEEAFELVGHVGSDARLGTSSRARVFVGVGGRPSRRTEIVVTVAVGPQFARPALLEGGGPILLGFEAGLRFYARDPAGGGMALFLEPGAGVDLRFPGVDPSLGLRAGGALRAWSSVALEVSVGGAFVAFRAFDTDHRSTVGGASGGVRVAFRFGGTREAE